MEAGGLGIQAILSIELEGFRDGKAGESSCAGTLHAGTIATGSRVLVLQHGQQDHGRLRSPTGAFPVRTCDIRPCTAAAGSLLGPFCMLSSCFACDFV